EQVRAATARSEAEARWRAEEQARRAAEDVRRRAEQTRQQQRDLLDQLARMIGQDPCWATLGLTPAATAEAVRQQYFRLAKQHHPDHGGDPAEFRRVQTAYERAQALLRQSGRAG